ncbi:LADA_0C00518g1_1 [Lachancea dasiensis]|uniref:LADA_0C00518g1_1 n=1 Tax=Lachancea dasiensis TaxID=1072105 RepID=A0A1G4IX48_9SACH|nr:LADA_0C00518g1_1 [Lachancea dasiensis]
MPSGTELKADHNDHVPSGNALEHVSPNSNGKPKPVGAETRGPTLSAQSSSPQPNSDADLETAKPTSAPQNTPEQSPDSGYLQSVQARAYGTKNDGRLAAEQALPPRFMHGDPSMALPADPVVDNGLALQGPNARERSQSPRTLNVDHPSQITQYQESEPRTEIISDDSRAAVIKNEVGGYLGAPQATISVTSNEAELGHDSKPKPPVPASHKSRSLSTSSSTSASSTVTTVSAPATESVQLPTISSLVSFPSSTEARHASPNSILTRRNVFATSASRHSTSNTDKLPPRGFSFSGVGSGTSPLVPSADRTFLTPHRLSFNTSRLVTDPHVTLDNNKKINISSLLNSRGEDMYTLRSREQMSSSPAFQGLLGSGELQNDGEGNDENDNSDQHRPSSNGEREFKTEASAVAIVPPPATQPQRIKSKLDDIRSRVLLDPNIDPLRSSHLDTSSSPRADDDIAAAGAAAAIITKMRSSPYATNEEASHSSRPGSASFRHYMRPVVRINHREYEPDDSDESAVIEDDTEDESYDEMPNRDSDKISWNKSGMKKRVTRRQSAPSANVKRRQASYPEETSDRTKGSRHSSVSSSSNVTSLLSAAKLLGKEPRTSKVKNEKKKQPSPRDSDDSESSSPKGNKPRRKNAAGSRSRSGCWICRLRKKKCTEEKPSCHNCLRLNLQCFYDHTKPDFISDPAKKHDKLEEIKKKTKEAKRAAMRRRP